MAHYSRRWRCIKCKKPYTAIRENSRCTPCSRQHQSERGAARCRKARKVAAEAKKAGLPKPRPTRVLALVGDYVCLPSPDPVEQDRVMSRARQKARDAAALADAKRLMALYVEASKPKRGRPRKGSVPMQEAA